MVRFPSHFPLRPEANCEFPAWGSTTCAATLREAQELPTGRGKPTTHGKWDATGSRSSRICSMSSESTDHESQRDHTVSFGRDQVGFCTFEGTSEVDDLTLEQSVDASATTKCRLQSPSTSSFVTPVLSPVGSTCVSPIAQVLRVKVFFCC